MAEELTAEQKKAIGIVEIHGVDYQTVAKRVRDFREEHPNWSIITKIQSAAELVQVKTTIKDETGRVIATGHAEEQRGATQINTSSPIENAETSSIGRALAVLGLGGQTLASAEEVSQALAQQKEAESVERLKLHNSAVRDHIESIVAMKAHLVNDEYYNAYEAWSEIPDEDKVLLWISTTAGGIWTTRERAQMKSNEWTEARKQLHGGEDDE